MSVKSFVKLMFLMFYDMPTLNKVYLILFYLILKFVTIGPFLAIIIIAHLTDVIICLALV